MTHDVAIALAETRKGLSRHRETLANRRTPCAAERAGVGPKVPRLGGLQGDIWIIATFLADQSGKLGLEANPSRILLRK